MNERAGGRLPERDGVLLSSSACFRALIFAYRGCAIFCQLPIFRLRRFLRNACAFLVLADGPEIEFGRFCQ